MIDLLVHPSYFGSIAQYVAQVNAGSSLIFEIHDNYQKQTYRNRCYIYGANGKQLLNIPIRHLKKQGRYQSSDVEIDYGESWQKLHIKSLDSAYSSSPFYEYYKDDIIPVIQKKHKYLLDLNFETIDVLNDCMQLEHSYQKSNKYQMGQGDTIDLRDLIQAKGQQQYNFQKYRQVFDEKHGFISNLSCLDLLFNEGPNALEYLEIHKNLLGLD